jgi:hypothetical protein
VCEFENEEAFPITSEECMICGRPMQIRIVYYCPDGHEEEEQEL